MLGPLSSSASLSDAIKIAGFKPVNDVMNTVASTNMVSMITQEDRDHAADVGDVVCEQCQTIYTPVPGYQNDGHQCDDNGLQDKYAI